MKLHPHQQKVMDLLNDRTKYELSFHPEDGYVSINAPTMTLPRNAGKTFALCPVCHGELIKGRNKADLTSAFNLFIIGSILGFIYALALRIMT